MNPMDNPDIVKDLLSPFVSPERMSKIERVVDGRTRTVVPVLDQITDLGNLYAVVRTAEALGYQEVHWIEAQRGLKRANRVAHGADEWLDIRRWRNAEECTKDLLGRGYRILATALGKNAVPIGEVDFTAKTALVFGNEKNGVSEEILKVADQIVYLPMTGFTQSFNLSVACAIALNHVFQDRMGRQGFHGDLSRVEKQALVSDFCRRSVNHSDLILERLQSGC